MGRYIIGDVHGAGWEFNALTSMLHGHQLYCVGDMFDRGFHAAMVWECIYSRKVQCVMGNHERKMLQFLTGQRPNLPPHYYYAMDSLRQYGVNKRQLIDFLADLPLTIPLDMGGREVIIAHAGVNPYRPSEESESWNVYGNDGHLDAIGAPATPWWDMYGTFRCSPGADALIVYGHLSQEPPYEAIPRIRYFEGKGRSDGTNAIASIGIDTGAVSGGPLTAYGLDDEAFVTYRTGKNHAASLKVELHSRGRQWARELCEFLKGNW
jgi:hypothetical protein